MTCYLPNDAWRILDAPEGVRKIWFTKPKSFDSRPIKLPCGQCIGCRLARSREWAVRCSHEAELREDNAFITLTYNDDALPSDRSLNHRHWQLFLKRLRRAIEPHRIKFFMCGEYGSKKMRPHYHACIFGYDFPDKEKHQYNRKTGKWLYTSDMLSNLWGKGFVTTGDVTFESAAYVARYVTKKMTGKLALAKYTKWDPETGEIYQDLQPEYCESSNGIGEWWALKNRETLLRRDEVIVNGYAIKPPRYYDKVFEKVDASVYDFDDARLEEIKAERVRAALERKKDSTNRRLRDREVVQSRRAERLVRPLEEEI